MKIFVVAVLALLSFCKAEEVSLNQGLDVKLSNPCWYTVSGGVTGSCLAESCCAGQTWISNLCPDWPSNYRCCFSSNSCASGCGTCGDSVAKEYACKLLDMYEAGTVYLKPNHFAAEGNNPYDGAAVLSNIRDTCFGKQAKRSAYCSAAPGGCVCLRGSMVKALWTYANDFYAAHKLALQVNALAGSCHSATSWHYQGNTMDVACTTPINHCSALVNFVSGYPLEELCYPGGPCAGHETWVHAAFK